MIFLGFFFLKWSSCNFSLYLVFLFYPSLSSPLSFCIMKYTLIGFCIIFLTSLVAAQSSSIPFYITKPIVGTVFKANSTESIEWLNGLKGLVQVSLLTGTSAGTMKSIEIICEVDGSANRCNWKVPTGLPRNATFALKFDYKKDGVPDSAYSSPFTIVGTKGVVVTESFVYSIASTTISLAASSTNASSILPAASTTAISLATANVTSSLVTPTSSANMDAKLTSMHYTTSESRIASATTVPNVTSGSAENHCASVFTLCILAFIAFL
ncbi:hypothetical protein EDC96DRAFT_508179 [Choanephora cucurbitarum]|nr:hypothetical protein EDC96DRAFT_508179 [Choanephora cucurbitarum]